MKMIYFPTHTGLNPRPASDYDLLVIRFARSIKAKNYRLEKTLEKELARFGNSIGEMDEHYSSGLNLMRCTIK